MACSHEPRHVGQVLAELMGGNCHPFGPIEGAFVAMSGDAHDKALRESRSFVTVPKDCSVASGRYP